MKTPEISTSTHKTSLVYTATGNNLHNALFPNQWITRCGLQCSFECCSLKSGSPRKKGQETLTLYKETWNKNSLFVHIIHYGIRIVSKFSSD